MTTCHIKNLYLLFGRYCRYLLVEIDFFMIIISYLLFFTLSAVCCVAAVKANSLVIRGKIEKNDQKVNRDNSVIKRDEKKNSECDNNESKNRNEENDRKEKENERKIKYNENERKGTKSNEENRNLSNKGHQSGKYNSSNRIWWDHRNVKNYRDDNKPCEKPSPSSNCNIVCTLIYDPLCATPDGFEGDSKTFDNECQLNVYNCQNPKASE